MRACVKPAMGQVELIDVPMPEPGPGQIVVKMTMSTVCGTCHECMPVDYSMCPGSGPAMPVMFGCQGEYYTVPNADINVAKVPDSVTDEQALLPTAIMST